MALAAETSFPSSFTAGDTVRVTIGDSKYPSSGWTLQVVLQSATESKSFNADEGDNNAFDLVISAADSAKITPGLYDVSYLYTEIGNGADRQSGRCEDSVTVYADPAQSPVKSIARQTLEIMEAALPKISATHYLTVNVNGQSSTFRNPIDLQRAIQQQRAIVAAEDAARVRGGGHLGRILHPL